MMIYEGSYKAILFLKIMNIIQMYIEHSLYKTNARAYLYIPNETTH